MFRFSIRDVLWLTVVVALCVAWSIDHTKTRIDWQQVRENERLRELAEKERFWAQMSAKTAREQKANIDRAAALRGITILDIESETVIRRPYLDD